MRVGAGRPIPGYGVQDPNWMLLVGLLDERNSTTLVGSDRSAMFSVGTFYSETAKTAGYLYLGIYDGTYKDNRGNYCAAVSGGTSASTDTVAALGSITITGQPLDSTAANGVCSCSVIATASSGTLNYKWQWYNASAGWVAVSDGSGSLWLSISGSATNLLTINGLQSDVQFRCVLSTATATPVVSLIATKHPQTSGSTITITEQPVSAAALSPPLGNGSVFCGVKATCTSGAITYTWQINQNGNWEAVVNGSYSGLRYVSGQGTEALWFNGVSSATQFRCVLSAASSNSVITNVVTISA